MDDAILSILEDSFEEEYLEFDYDKVIKALSLLLNNPKALKTVKEKVDVHVGNERLMEESNIKNLVNLQAIIKEPLRLYPAAQISVIHESISVYASSSADDSMFGACTVLVQQHQPAHRFPPPPVLDLKNSSAPSATWAPAT
ncbi:cytochrome P450 [Artemisia annua]|uniref:Cytochrome P450 n=1 Tax=Artemisia annua TaxID=35608 RepID=A0A2U1KFA5_ARTAN|nr:cytochrome P450 [Artemisia annua]